MIMAQIVVRRASTFTMRVGVSHPVWSTLRPREVTVTHGSTAVRLGSSLAL